MSEPLLFSDYVSGKAGSQENVTDDDQAVENEEIVEEEAVETEASSEQEGQEAPEEEGQEAPNTEQSQASVTPEVTFEDRMRALGMEPPEGVDRTELYDNALKRIDEGTRAMREAAELRQKLEQMQSAPQQVVNQSPAPEPQQPEQPAESPRERLFRKIEDYDRTLLNYVERDTQGRAKPIAEYGEMAVEAAKTINHVEQQQQRQADLLVKNPDALFSEHMPDFEKLAEEKAASIVEQRIKQMREEQEKALQEQKQTQAQQQEQQALQRWHEENKGKIFRLAEDGQPLRVFGQDGYPQNDYAKTEVGRYFMQRLGELSQELPEGTPELTIRNLALREAELAAQQAPVAQAPVQQPAPEPVKTQAEKQGQRFVEQRGTAAPQQNTPVATSDEVAAGMPNKLRFASLARAIPENQDRVASWQ